MNNSKIKNNAKELYHHIDQNYDKITEICHPLFQHTPITYFDYVYFYSSGELVKFSTSPVIGSYYYKNQLNPTYQEFKLLYDLGYKYTFLSPLMELPAGASRIKPEKYEHNVNLCLENKVCHRIYLLKRNREDFFLYGFGCTLEKKSIIDFFLNSLSLLEKFVVYFEKKAKSLIFDAHANNRFILPNYHIQAVAPSENEDINVNFSPELKNLLNELDCNASIPRISPDVSLSPREIECLNLLSQGYTMKMIAKEISLSPRTVEYYLKNIKERHGMHTKNQLINFWKSIVL